MKALRILTIFVLLLFTVESFGQIKLTFREKSKIYYRSVDTLICKVREKEINPKFVLTSEGFILSMLPDTISNAVLSKTLEFKAKRKFEGAIWIEMQPLHIDEDKIKVFTTIRKQTNRQMLAWELKEQISNYILVFKYDNSLNEYKLIEIEKGIFIR